MITLTQTNIKCLERLGYGAVSQVYRDGDYAYKIYKPRVNSNYGQTSNPCLSRFNSTRRRLIKKSKQIKYTDIIDEEIEVDQKFGGVKYKYQNGSPLSHIYINLPYFKKRELCLKLIRNNEELLQHHIYIQDYKLTDIICDENNEPHFIDLDDGAAMVTIFPNRGYQNESLYALKQIIMAIFNDASINLLSQRTREQLDSYQTYHPLFSKHKTTSGDISSYLVSKEQSRKFLFIDIDESINQIDTIRKTLQEQDVKLVLTIDKFDYNKEEYYYSVAKELKEQGIPVYDILCLNFDYSIESYTEASNTEGYYTYQKELKYIPKQ